MESRGQEKNNMRMPAHTDVSASTPPTACVAVGARNDEGGGTRSQGMRGGRPTQKSWRMGEL